ncbi:sensor histidine kinase [Luteolibacter sp.]|uniref:sensor histidine kinase n=1 Tax=Luteolibacter sp. TaxID=1962973 RepID=UPI003264EDD6
MPIFVRLRLLVASAALTVPAPASPVELTKVAEVRALSRADKFERLPVKLEGVLLADPASGLFLQDDTGCIWMKGTDPQFKGLRRGDRVEARGVSAPGHFAPIMELETVSRLGTAPIPPPTQVTFWDLDSGRYDGQWVEIEGIVRQANPNANPRVVLASGGGRLPLFFSTAHDSMVPVDSKIRVMAIALNQFTRTGQTLHPLLFVPRDEKPVIIEYPLADLPLRRIDRLMAFSDRLDQGHRIRLRGVVAHQQAGEAIWLEENGRGIRVNLKDSVTYSIGEQVEVSGFPVRSEHYYPELEDAEVIRIAHGPPPKPEFLGTSVAALDHDAGLITLQAKVVELMRVPKGLRFVLRDDQRDFIAVLNDSAQVISPHWQNGTLFRATGICSVSSVPAIDRTGTVDPREFELIIRTPNDLVVIEAPSWWTAERRSWLLAAISAVLALTVFGIFWSSRRKIRLSTAARRQSEAEFAAILSERGRIAREIHDTLAQGLGAISLHLEMMKDDIPSGSPADHHRQDASEITRDCLNEARQSIWNMRSQVIEDNGLDGALAGVFDQLTDIDGLGGNFEVTGEPFPLPPVVENNLLRIGQEAITNAVKHASAKRIDLTLTYSPQLVTIRVKDDGRGFEPEKVHGTDSHFGLLGLKERAHEIRAALRVESQPGHGTEVTLEYPIQLSEIALR